MGSSECLIDLVMHECKMSQIEFIIFLLIPFSIHPVEIV